MRRSLAVSLAGLAALGATVAGMSPAVADDATPAPAYQMVDASALGVTSDLTVPWRAEQAADGTVAVLFGTGVSQYSVAPGTSAVAASSDSAMPASTASQPFVEPSTSPDSNPDNDPQTTPSDNTPSAPTTTSGKTASSADWTCELSVREAVSKAGSQLKSYVGIVCTNRPGQINLEYWFDRSSWSGWRQYSNHVTTAWTSSQSQGTPIYSQCGSGGTYNYRGAVTAHVRNANSINFGTPNSRGDGSGRFTCGTGVS